MRLECECCGETFYLKKRQMKNVIVKDFDTDSDVPVNYIICPICGGENRIGDSVVWAIKQKG